jgi:hypothetical protein
MRKKKYLRKSATNGTFAVEEARLDFSVRLVGPVTRILPRFVTRATRHAISWRNLTDLGILPFAKSLMGGNE